MGFCLFLTGFCRSQWNLTSFQPHFNLALRLRFRSILILLKFELRHLLECIFQGRTARHDQLPQVWLVIFNGFQRFNVSATKLQPSAIRLANTKQMQMQKLVIYKNRCILAVNEVYSQEIAILPCSRDTEIVSYLGQDRLAITFVKVPPQQNEQI